MLSSEVVGCSMRHSLLLHALPDLGLVLELQEHSMPHPTSVLFQLIHRSISGHSRSQPYQKSPQDSPSKARFNNPAAFLSPIFCQLPAQHDLASARSQVSVSGRLSSPKKRARYRPVCPESVLQLLMFVQGKSLNRRSLPVVLRPV
jgi:hypothetical protein